MTSPLTRVRRGFVVLLFIFCIAVLGYRFGANYSWIEAIWLVFVIISSVGFAEKSVNGPGFQLFTILVIAVGMSAAAYTVGGFIQLMFEGELARVMGTQRMKREINKLKNHVILCGFGRMGQVIAEGLVQLQIPYVVIDNEPAAPDELAHFEHLRIIGDAADETLLLEAGVKRASAIVSSIPNDAANVFITLTARDLNKEILILSRAEQHSTEKKLRQAGADRVVMPTLVSANQLVRMITRPSTADLINLVSDSSLNIELDELKAGPECKLIGVDVRSSNAHREHKLLVVAIQKKDGSMIFNPEADYVIQVNDILLVMGLVHDIERFRQRFAL